MSLIKKIIKSWLLLASFVVDSVVMVHVDWSDVEHKLRVVQYDVEKQQLLRLDYVSQAVENMSLGACGLNLTIKNTALIEAEKALSASKKEFKEAEERHTKKAKEALQAFEDIRRKSQEFVAKSEKVAVKAKKEQEEAEKIKTKKAKKAVDTAQAELVKAKQKPITVKTELKVFDIKGTLSDDYILIYPTDISVYLNNTNQDKLESTSAKMLGLSDKSIVKNVVNESNKMNLRKILLKNLTKGPGKEFHAFLDGKEAEKSLLQTDSCIQKKEKGVLGELLTDLTCFAYGYKKLEAKLNPILQDQSDNCRYSVYIPVGEKKAEATQVLLTAFKFHHESYSYEAFSKDIDPSSLKDIIEGPYYKKPLYDLLKEAYDEKKLIVFGQCYLSTGFIKTPYYDDYKDPVRIRDLNVGILKICDDVAENEMNKFYDWVEHNINATQKQILAKEDFWQNLTHQKTYSVRPVVSAYCASKRNAELTQLLKREIVGNVTPTPENETLWQTIKKHVSGKSEGTIENLIKLLEAAL